MNLPQEFCRRMKDMLRDEYDDFIKSYDSRPQRSLRVNTLKADSERFFRQNLFDLERVEWCPDGFYYADSRRPGLHPYHRAGVYYIQEASAMAPVVCAEIKPGEKVLDLCAAPGGKSSRAAAALQGSGILVSNEIVPSRAKILSFNLERMGVKNAIVTNESPADLEKFFPAFFDKIIVDAPCSGEGMFRKDPSAVSQWSQQRPDACAVRQGLILDSADKMLSAGGRIIYSTCTFAPQENEMAVAAFLDRHPEYRLINPTAASFFSPGRPEFANGRRDIKKAMRLFPHKLKGEGHFVAVLEKTDGQQGKIRYQKTVSDKKILTPWFDFEKNNLKGVALGNFMMFGSMLYSLPDNTPDLTGIKVLRRGLQLGEMKKGRFEPSHSLAMALKTDNAQRENMPLDDERVESYLCGQTVRTDNSSRGYRLMAVDGYTMGWGKCDGRIIKNHYPKGLRIMK